jgi:hypothetical protein
MRFEPSRHELNRALSNTAPKVLLCCLILQSIIKELVLGVRPLPWARLARPVVRHYLRSPELLRDRTCSRKHFTAGNYDSASWPNDELNRSYSRPEVSFWRRIPVSLDGARRFKRRLVALPVRGLAPYLGAGHQDNRGIP